MGRIIRFAEIYKTFLESTHVESNLNDITSAIKDIRKLGVINPFLSSEVIINDNVKLEVSKFDGALWISSISTIDRGKGDASKVLKMICDIADKYNVVIRMKPEPYGTKKGLNKGQLVSWYKRHGFKKTEWGEMERIPNNI